MIIAKQQRDIVSSKSLNQTLINIAFFCDFTITDTGRGRE